MNGDGKSEAVSLSTGGLSVEIKLAISVVGIYGCYLTSGILQEHIYSYRSPEDESRFSATLFLLWVQCLVNVAFAYAAMAFNGRSGDKMPQGLFGTAGFAYIGAMVCSIEALKYVNFPTKELGKSCKMIPVMLFGVLFAKKKYTVVEYLCVGLITTGIVVFNLSGSHKQERLKASCKPTVHEMMFFMNAWALAYLSMAAYLSGQGSEGLTFCIENPAVMSSLLGFALAAALGQNFIYFTISNFNPLVCTTITTTRKFFTILFSVLVYGHHINAQQWGGIVMVFSGLGYDIRGKYQKRRVAAKVEKEDNPQP